MLPYLMISYWVEKKGMKGYFLTEKYFFRAFSFLSMDKVSIHFKVIIPKKESLDGFDLI